jgi:hypothetical protein
MLVYAEGLTTAQRSTIKCKRVYADSIYIKMKHATVCQVAYAQQQQLQADALSQHQVLNIAQSEGCHI